MQRRKTLGRALVALTLATGIGGAVAVTAPTATAEATAYRFILNRNSDHHTSVFSKRDGKGTWDIVYPGEETSLPSVQSFWLPAFCTARDTKPMPDRVWEKEARGRYINLYAPRPIMTVTVDC